MPLQRGVCETLLYSPSPGNLLSLSPMACRQIQELQQELAMHDSMAARKDVSYAPYNERQRADLKAMVTDFLFSPGTLDSIEPLELLSVRHMREILFCCREISASSGGSIPRGGAAGGGGASSSNGVGTGAPHMAVLDGARAMAAAAVAAAAAARSAAEDGQHYVGDEDTVQAGGVGIAPDDARPDPPISGDSGDVEPGGGSAVVERMLAMQLGGPSQGGGIRGKLGASSTSLPPPVDR